MRLWPKKRPERTAIEGAVLTWLSARSPKSMAWAVVGVILFGTLGYWIVGAGEIGPLDALYMAIITVSTVGYGDRVDTDAGHAFSVVYIIIGVGVFSLTISTLAAALVAGRVGEVIGRRRMEREIKALRDHFILCGYGRFGQITGAEIVSKDLPLVAIDSDSETIEDAEEHGVLGILGDATEEEALEKAGIERARALLCTLPTDAENVYVILNARELRPNMPIVALARDRRAESKLIRAGANYVVSPYSIGATHMARQILSPNLAQVFNLASAGGEEGLKQVGVQLDEFAVSAGSSLIDMKLKDSPIRRDFNVMLVAVIERDGERHFNPGPNLELHEGAVLVAVGPMDGLEKLRDVCAGPPQKPEIEE
ncbi:MAG: potassium channel protein [Planctomycetota bacterium]|nr:potassium channel protein [Planctomycetota bacterium]